MDQKFEIASTIKFDFWNKNIYSNHTKGMSLIVYEKSKLV